MNTDLITHLEATPSRLSVARTGALGWSDEAWHRSQCEHDPVGYALLALLPALHPRHRGRILLQLLLTSWAGLDDDARAMLTRVVRVLVLGLPATDGLTVLLALRHRRANHKHVTRAAVRLLEHADADRLIATHRRAVRAALEHALGKSSARGSARRLDAGDAVTVHRVLLRFAADRSAVAARVRALYTSPVAVAVAGPVESPSLVDLDLAPARPATVSATNRGDLAATLVHLYRGGSSADLEVALERYLVRAADGLARFPGTLAVVVDRSGSMRGYGDREWAVLSQVEALVRVLERRCDRLVVVPVGSEGGTDLAMGVLDALAARPDLVAVVSDGYENTNPGDLARVVASWSRAGGPTPIVFCHSTFGHSDDLTLRRPAPSLPQRAFWHEADFGPLLLWLLAHTGTAAADQALRDALRDRLAEVERRLADHTNEGSQR